MQVYTAIAGKYPIARNDVPCFAGDGLFNNPVLEAKRYKVLPHLFFPDAAITVWVDGNVWLTHESFAREALGNYDIAMFSHPYRATVWQEFGALKEQKRFQIPFLQKQLAEQEQSYRDAGLPDDAPLFECNFMVRRNIEPVNAAMESWWAQICRWQWRDQVSLPYVLSRNCGLRVNALTGNIREHAAFRYVSQY